MITEIGNRVLDILLCLLNCAFFYCEILDSFASPGLLQNGYNETVWFQSLDKLLAIHTTDQHI